MDYEHELKIYYSVRSNKTRRAIIRQYSISIQELYAYAHKLKDELQLRVFFFAVLLIVKQK